MLLKEWIKKENSNGASFASLAGVAQPTICKLLKGQCNMHASTAVKIEKATKGEVSRVEAAWPDDYEEIEKAIKKRRKERWK